MPQELAAVPRTRRKVQPRIANFTLLISRSFPGCLLIDRPVPYYAGILQTVDLSLVEA